MANESDGSPGMSAPMEFLFLRDHAARRPVGSVWPSLRREMPQASRRRRLSVRDRT